MTPTDIRSATALLQTCIYQKPSGMVYSATTLSMEESSLRKKASRRTICPTAIRRDYTHGFKHTTVQSLETHTTTMLAQQTTDTIHSSHGESKPYRIQIKRKGKNKFMFFGDIPKYQPDTAQIVLYPTLIVSCLSISTYKHSKSTS